MRIVRAQRIAGGVFSEVFAIGDGRAVKAFVEVIPSVNPRADPTLIPRIGFAAEVRAYDSLRKRPDLEAYCPRFFGNVNPLDLPLPAEWPLAAGCGVVLEHIPGRDEKLSSLPRQLRERVEGVIDRIQDATGVDWPWDGSCFIPGTRAEFTIIDIATPALRCGTSGACRLVCLRLISEN